MKAKHIKTNHCYKVNHRLFKVAEIEEVSNPFLQGDLQITTSILVNPDYRTVVTSTERILLYKDDEVQEIPETQLQQLLSCKNRFEARFDSIIETPLPNFALETEYKKILYAQQRKQQGFDDTETWNLDSVVLQFLLPRLKRFKELTNGYPPTLTFEEWQDKLQSMIDYIEAYLNDDWENSKDDNPGYLAMCKYFHYLWW